jgi:hypothetical protein
MHKPPLAEREDYKNTPGFEWKPGAALFYPRRTHVATGFATNPQPIRIADKTGQEGIPPAPRRRLALSRRFGNRQAPLGCEHGVERAGGSLVHAGDGGATTAKPLIAFFPGYPLAGRAVAWLFCIPMALALLLVSQIGFLSGTIGFAVFAAHRFNRPVGAESTVAVAAFLFSPPTFFFHMAYSERLFVALLLLSTLALLGRWPQVITAVIIGATTAVRATGFALVLPFVWHLFRCCGRRPGSLGLLRALSIGILACWGLIGFVLFQAIMYGDPFAFARAHDSWTHPTEMAASRRILGLVILEPVWSVYRPDSGAYWRGIDGSISPLFSLQFANPIWFMACVVLIVVGAWKRWLYRIESVVGAALLAIPYITHSERALMMGHARYSAVVFPAYIVLGNLLARSHRSVRVAFFAASVALLWMYSALFAAGYRFI